jgi:hypothetical protein
MQHSHSAEVSGSISLTTIVDATVPNATTLIQNYHTALTAGTGISPNIPYNNVLWLSAWETIDTAIPLIETNALLRNAVKSAFLVKPWTPGQIAAIYANPEHHVLFESRPRPAADRLDGGRPDQRRAELGDRDFLSRLGHAGVLERLLAERGGRRRQHRLAAHLLHPGVRQHGRGT